MDSVGEAWLLGPGTQGATQKSGPLLAEGTDIGARVKQHAQQLKDCAEHLARAQQQFAFLQREVQAKRTHDHGAQEIEALKRENEALNRALKEERTAKVLIEQELRLGEAQRVAKQARWRISGTMLFLGVPSLFVGLTNGIGRFFGLIGNPNHWGYWIQVGASGATLMFLAPLPSDDIPIRCACAVSMLAVIQILLLYCAGGVLALSGTYCAFDADVCPVLGHGIGAAGVVGGIAAVQLARTVLKLRPDVERASMLEVWAWTREHLGTLAAVVIFGTQFWLVPWAVVQHERGAFVLTPSDALVELHSIMRSAWTLWSVAFIGSCLLADPTQQAHPAVVSMLVHGIGCAANILSLLSEAVSGLRTFLGSFQVGEQARSAAGVAALVGKMGSTKALTLAKELFRGLPFSSLSLRDLATNEDTGLNQHVVPAKLGEVDAFMSHSWSDAATAKWAAIEEWAGEFASQHKRSPLLWLDKGTSHPPNRGPCEASRKGRAVAVLYTDLMVVGPLSREQRASISPTSRPTSHACPSSWRAARSCSSWRGPRTPRGAVPTHALSPH